MTIGHGLCHLNCRHVYLVSYNILSPKVWESRRTQCSHRRSVIPPLYYQPWDKTNENEISLSEEGRVSTKLSLFTKETNLLFCFTRTFGDHISLVAYWWKISWVKSESVIIYNLVEHLKRFILRHYVPLLVFLFQYL